MLHSIAVLVTLLSSSPRDASDCRQAIDRAWSQCSVADYGAGKCLPDDAGLSDECAGWMTPAEREAVEN